MVHKFTTLLSLQPTLLATLALSLMNTRDVKASRPNWSRGQNFGLGLGLGLVTSGLGLGLGLRTLWSRPRTLIFNFKEPVSFIMLILSLQHILIPKVLRYQNML